jgi:hypothetical protein
MCCSQWGYCGTAEAYCGACCQNGGCWNNPNPTSTTSTTTSGSTLPPYTADHGEDSRLIAYVGNWQACPTDAQVAAYSHIGEFNESICSILLLLILTHHFSTTLFYPVIAFSVSYTWSAAKNNCDAQCNIGTSVPICNNVNDQALIDKWRSMGKKVIFSIGGAGMGGSWLGKTLLLQSSISLIFRF